LPSFVPLSSMTLSAGVDAGRGQSVFAVVAAIVGDADFPLSPVSESSFGCWDLVSIGSILSVFAVSGTPLRECKRFNPRCRLYFLVSVTVGYKI